jgi:hypothetical protein
MTYAPGRNYVFKENDIITIQGDPSDIKEFIDESKTELVGKDKAETISKEQKGYIPCRSCGDGQFKNH